MLRVALFGATGMVGQGALRECLAAQQVGGPSAVTYAYKVHISMVSRLVAGLGCFLNLSAFMYVHILVHKQDMHMVRSQPCNAQSSNVLVFRGTVVTIDLTPEQMMVLQCLLCAWQPGGVCAVCGKAAEWHHARQAAGGGAPGLC
jgi:hypothetical protein